VTAADRVDYPALERSVQKWWGEHGVLQRYLHRNDQSDKQFSFLDGPITANNPMGVHHAWGRTYKDIYQRYHTMRGYKQRYQNGFDSQGLWVEVEVEKELGFRSKLDIEAFGIAEFVERCKERVFKFAKRMIEQSIRLGYWMDWGNDYYTLSDENNYTIWSFLKKCFERGLIYKGHDVMTWCPRCATSISHMETLTEDYQETSHLSLYVRFPLADRPGEYLLAWTTTPWTLAANVVTAGHPDLPYVKVAQDGEYYYLAKALLPLLRALKGRDKGDYHVVETLRGSEMVGWKYRGPFDELPAQQGIVHIAPGSGREDFALAKEFHLPVIAPVDEFGVYLEGFDWLTGQTAADVGQQTAENLAQKGLLYRPQTYKHRYPICWRCKTELIFRLVDEWYISMGQLRYEIMDVAREATWIPAFGLERELDWLRNMDDWLISKKRYWGLALPIYECPQCGTFEVIGSRQELKERAAEGWEEFEGHSPHRPWVDAVKIKCRGCGSEVARIKDVGNPWLDAGIVPFSTLRYRIDRKYWEQWFPADFVTESFPGQFKNWFYSLLVMSTVLEGTAPFKTLFGYGTLLGEDGMPMHKSKGNLVIFDEAAERVGSDTMRWLFATHVPEQSLNFPRIPTDEDIVRSVETGLPVRLSEKWMLVRRVNGAATFSVHLGDWPKVNEELLDEKLTNETHLVMRIVGLGRAAREKAQIRVRQPLGAMFVRVADRDEEETLLRLSWQVLEELNIRQLHLMSDDSNMLAYTLKPQMRVLGPKYGSLVQKILAALKALDAHGAQEAATALHETGKLNLTIEGHQIELIPDELEVVATARPGFVAAEDRGYVVALETTITPELREEGLVRDLTHYVQDMRKRAGFNIEDHIQLSLYTSEDLVASLGKLAAADKAELACHRRYGQGREALAGDAVHGKVH
jgi:isoleucyl-tRNA synthetase